MTVRPVNKTVKPKSVLEGAGVRLKRLIAQPALDYVDPFLLLDHFGSDNPDDYIKGFPMHPHRGIETVTYMLAGEVDHKDTLGNSGSIQGGDVQWMTAGGGIMHEEMPRPHDGLMEGFQLWVNLPAELKMTRPRYQDIRADAIPVVQKEGMEIRVIAGTFEMTNGPVTGIAADPLYVDIDLAPESMASFPLPEDHTAFIYAFRGSGIIGPQRTPLNTPELAVLESGDLLGITAGSDGLRFLLVAGKPLGEPIARYGPFVMNTQAEIEQALMDLKNGSFIWEE